jgi:SAM-dependent methyltransferase
MNGIQSYQIGRHKITLALREDVGPVSPYSLLLAENISDLTGQTVVDVGSGSGFLSIVARLQGATRVYLLDTYESAIALALENAERNRVREGLIHLPIGSSMIPLPEGERVNVIISNPAQLPLPQMERENSPFYAGPEAARRRKRVATTVLLCSVRDETLGNADLVGRGTWLAFAHSETLRCAQTTFLTAQMSANA